MNSLKKVWKSLGPGLVSGASDDDPSGIVTYSLAGAMFGMATLWATLVTVPLMTAVQEACARLAFVTHRGLVANLRKHVPMPVLWLSVIAFVGACTFNLGADLKMMANSAELIIPLPTWVWIALFAGTSLFVQIYFDYASYAKILKWMCLALFAYVGVAFIVHVDWFMALTATFAPPISLHQSYWLAALFGTAFSPYLCIWQSTQEVEVEKTEGCLDAGCKDTHLCNPEEILYCRRVDIGVGMSFANLIAWFIILTAATVLHANGIYEISRLADLTRILEPLAGPYAQHLFVLGIVGTGMLAIPILSGSAAYAMTEAAGIKQYGFSKTLKEAPQFYLWIILVTIAGIGVTLTCVKSIDALVYSAIVNAFISPMMLIGIIYLTRRKEIMGRYVNGPVSTVLLWTTLILICSMLAFWLVFR